MSFFSIRLNVQIGWPSTFVFARHQRDTLSSLPPETRDVVARDSGESNVRNRYRKRVNFSINLHSHLCAGVTLICYTEPQKRAKQLSKVATYLISFCRVSVSQSQLYYVVSISALQFACILVNFFG